MNIQEIIDRAVKIATKAAMDGHPIAGILWVPPSTAVEDPLGAFAVIPMKPLNGSDKPPWE